MTDIPIGTPEQPADPRNIAPWKRGLLMLLMGLAFHIASMLLCLLAVVQWVLVLLQLGANRQLQAFACSLGQYLRQIAEFVGFVAEKIPFPFADWPGGAAPEPSDSGPPA